MQVDETMVPAMARICRQVEVTKKDACVCHCRTVSRYPSCLNLFRELQNHKV